MKKIILLIVLVSIRLCLFAQEVYVCFGNSIVKCDISNCSYETIGHTFAKFFDLAVTPNGKLYGTNGKYLYSIDTNDASTETIGLLTDTFVGMGQWINALVAIDNQYLFGLGTVDTLYKISVANAQKTAIGTIGYVSAGDLTFYKGALYLTELDGNLIEIILNSSMDRIININNLGLLDDYGGYGITTVGNFNCNDTNLKIIIFSGPSIDEVESNTTNTTTICFNIFPDIANGAAYKMEGFIPTVASSLKIPNVFTPNNDGYNDTFVPFEYSNVIESNIKIYNRWGKTVYESTEVPFAWNGQTKYGEKCCDGVYFYIISCKSLCNKKEIIKGTVTIIR